MNTLLLSRNCCNRGCTGQAFEGVSELTFSSLAANLWYYRKTNYYPYGLQWENRNQNFSNNAYGHTSKEMQDNEWQDKGLDCEDFGARMYDPVIGRWWSVDPMSGKFKAWSPYNYCFNNPVRLIDPDGASPIDPTPPGPGYYQANVSSRMIAFSLRHPIIAAAIGLPMKGSTNISTNSVRFSTRIGLNENDEHEGSQVNAFRHVLWQSEITAQFGCSIAQEVGALHEENAWAISGTNLQTTFSTLAEADETIDLLNNVIGRSIGLASNGESMQFRSLMTLEYYKRFGLWTATASFDTNGKVNGYVIGRSVLSQAQYDEAKQVLNGLNSNGYTHSEQWKMDAAAKERAEAESRGIYVGPKF